MKTQKKKLLLITPYFYPRPGGLEHYTYNIAKRLRKNHGWDVVVVTTGSDKKSVVESFDGLKVYRLPVLATVSNTPIHFAWLQTIKKIIAEEKPTVINVNAPVPFIADITAFVDRKTPLVVTYHTGTMKKGKLFADALIGPYEAFFLPKLFDRADKIICVSDFVKHTVVNGFAKKAVVIHPGVDTILFRPNGHERSKKTVLFIGKEARMYRLKGLPTLLTAMKKVPQATLRVIGPALPVSLPNVEFVGTKTGKDLISEMQQASVVVLPSTKNSESFGMILIEAMACGIPVIGSKTGGIVEIIDNEKTGLLVEPDDSEALTQALRKVLNDEKLSLKLGAGGFAKVQSTFHWDRQTGRTDEVLSKLIRTTDN